VQGGQTLWQLSQNYQVDAVAVTAYNNLAEQSDLQPGQAQQAPVSDRQANRSEPYTVAPNQSGQATTGPQQLQAGQPTAATSEVNALLKAKQAVALNRLKQKSNRLQDSLAELRSEELNSDAATQVAESSSKLEEAGDNTLSTKAGVTSGAVDDANRELTLRVENAPNSAINLPQKSELASVAEPTAVFPATVPEYQVKKGDTLSTIARSHGITLAELVNVNHLTDPNRLQIDQQLIIPAASTLVPRQVAQSEDLQESPESAASVTIGGLKHAGKRSVVAVVPSTDFNQNDSVSVPHLQKTDGQASATLLNHKSAKSQPVRVTVLAAPLAETTLHSNTTEVHSGVGIPVTSPIRQPARKFSAKLEQPSSPYVENLRLEILKLREKYQAQQTDRRAVPVAAEPGSVVVPITVPAPSKAVIPSQPSIEFKANRRSEPINPFASDRAPLTSKSTLRKESATKNSEPAIDSPQVATAPTSVNAFDSLHSLRGRQVSPELPPLAAVDRYLPKPIDTTAPFREGFIWPTKGLLTSGFGWRWGRMHKGIDIAAPIGTPVVAAAAGVVVSAGWNSGGYGNLVDIQHADGSLTRYAHNNRILVQVGQQVEQGEQISEMGSTGYSTGPHCHFEVHPPGHGAVNPIAFLPSR
jgi:lysostaphin